MTAGAIRAGGLSFLSRAGGPTQLATKVYGGSSNSSQQYGGRDTSAYNRETFETESIDFNRELPVLERIKDFLISSGPDPRAAAVPHFVRRSIEVRRLDSTGQPYVEVSERVTNSTAMGMGTHFLADFLAHSPSHANELTPYVVMGAENLCALQYDDPNTARFGGFKGSTFDLNTTTLGTAAAGRGLLRAFRVTANPKYLVACQNAATFLKVMHSPNFRYSALYGETPIPEVTENAGFAGFCDRITSSDIICVTASNWNLVAAVFLKELESVTGVDYSDIYLRARDWQATGVTTGCDYFALKSTSPSTHVSVTWPFFTGHAAADGAWHRYGEFATGTPHTVGTDQIEYGLASLYDLGYSVATLRSAYETYRDLAHASSGAFGRAFDAAISFSGFFRINSPLYGGDGSKEEINPTTSRHFGTYYDVQGAGTLLKFKKDLYPSDYEASHPLVELASQRGSMVDQDFETIWSTGPGYEWYKQGIIPIALAGTSILQCMEHWPVSTRANGKERTDWT